jgi:hypothetical protein
MRVLELTIKKEWFDMIASGEKKEEYREIKKHWISRLCCTSNMLDGLKEFDAVLFRNGYSGGAPLLSVKCEGIDFGYGKKEWGAIEGQEYFVIKLGEIIK